MEHNNTGDINKCPFMSGAQKKTAGAGTSNRDWWPNELKLNISYVSIRHQSPILWEKILIILKNLNSIDYNASKQDVVNLMTDSQDWWPADYGHYGPFLFVWLGIVQEPTVCVMVEVAQVREHNVLLH